MLQFTQALGLALHKKESRLSPDFWKGLLLALGFHIALVVCFKIVAPPNFDGLQVIIPTPVEIDLGGQPTTAVLQGRQATPFPSRIPLPGSLSDSLKNYCANHTPEPFYTKKEAAKEADFSEVEVMPYEPLENITDEERS